MSAAELRQAAALMRARAEAAASGSWVAEAGMVIKDLGRNPKYVAYCFNEPGGSVADAEHIASWHPAGALAVADLLEAVAAVMPAGDDGAAFVIKGSTYYRAIELARLYLGSADD